MRRIVHQSAMFACQALERRMLLSLSPAGSEFRANLFTTSDQSTPAIAADADGDFVVAWQSYAQDGSNFGIFARRYNAAGAAQGAEFRVNTFTTGSQRFPSVAMDADGDFVVAWDSDAPDGSSFGIFAQRYDAAGAAQGGEFRVNSFTTGGQVVPKVAMDAGGDLVVVWMSNAQDGSGYGVYAQRYNPLGVAQGGEFRVNTVTSSGQSNPSVAMAADGEFVVAWAGNGGADPSGVYAQRYDAQGVAQGGEFLVNTVTTGNQTTPAAAMDADGDFVIGWTGAYDIFAQLYNAAGVAQGAEFRTDPVSGIRGGAAVAMDFDGDFLITWMDGLLGSGQDGSGSGVYAHSFDAAGISQGGAFRVNTFTTGFQSNPTVAMDSDGNAITAWQSQNQDGSGIGVYAQRYNESTPDTAPPMVGGVVRGGKLVLPYSTHDTVLSQLVIRFSEDMSVAGGTGGAQSITNPANWLVTHNGNSVALTSVTFGFSATNRRFEAVLNFSPIINGNFLVKARDNLRDLSGNPLDGDFDGVAGGAFVLPFSLDSFGTRGDEIPVNTFTTGQQAAPSVASDASGNFMVVWTSDGQDGSGIGIYGRRYNSAGVPLASEFRVNTFTTGDQYDPFVAMNGAGDHVVVWSSGGQDGSGYGVYAQRYNAAGAPQGGEFRVNTTTVNHQWMPDVAMDPWGNFVVTWASEVTVNTDDDIFAQRFNSAGVKAGTEFKVNINETGMAGFQTQPGIAMDAEGDFIIVWTASVQDPDGSPGIFARRYSAAGNLQQGTFGVNIFTTGIQSSPAVAMDPAGNFVISWNSVDQDGSGTGVYWHRSNASGMGVGAEYRANTFTADNQSNATVALESDGDLVISWSSWQQDGGGYGVYAQRYNALAFPQGGEFRVNTYTPNWQGDSAVSMDATGSFVVAFFSGRADDSDFGINVQRYGLPRTPVVGVVTDTPDPVLPGNSITLSADDVVSADGDIVGVVGVLFYRESNGVTGLQVGTEGDALVGTAATAVSGIWSVDVSTTGLAPGTYTYWAQATDDAGLIGVPASTTSTVAVSAPAVTAASFDFETAPQVLRFTFDQNVSASLGVDDVVLENLTTLTTIPWSDLGLTYDASTNTATFSYTGNAGGIAGVLADGNYRATLIAAGITNSVGTPLAADHVFGFFFLRGDANHDRTVDITDLGILATNWQQSPRVFSQGDFDLSGTVDITDLGMLATNWQHTLPAGGSIASRPAARVKRIVELTLT